MLLAVEGGGFFSSSVSGYSKGLTILLLGQKNKEKPMKVAPWKQYQLVDKKTNPDPQLASGKNGLVHECTSFMCFCHAASGPESPTHLNARPAQCQEVLPEPQVFDESKDLSHSDDCAVDVNRNRKTISLKSNLKKPETSFPISAAVDGGCPREHKALSENDVSNTCQMERKVQWTDASGGQLFQIREFEISENGSECGFDNGNEKICSCSIM